MALKTVLIVDDVETDRLLIARTVSAAGFTPAFANDGSEALAKAKSVRPALILMDVVMPNMDGYAACRQLKKDPLTAAIPVVLVTSKGTESDKFWGQRQGAAGHVGKPFSPEELTAIIHQFISR